MKKRRLVTSVLLTALVTFFIALPSASAAISPAGGTYTGVQVVCCLTGLGTHVYYTTDGTDPRNSDTRVSGSHIHFDVDGTLTLKSVTFNDVAGTYGKVYTAKYRIRSFPVPRIRIIDGTADNPEVVRITNLPRDCQAYYTTDGTDPANNSEALLYDGASISLGDSMTLRVAFVKKCYCIRDIAKSEPLAVEWGPVKTVSY